MNHRHAVLFTISHHLIAFAIVVVLLQRSAAARAEYSSEKFGSVIVHSFVSPKSSKIPDVSITRDNETATVSYDFDHDGVVDVVEILSAGVRIRKSGYLDGQFHFLKIQKTKSTTFVEADFSYSSLARAYYLVRYREKPIIRRFADEQQVPPTNAIPCGVEGNSGTSANLSSTGDAVQKKVVGSDAELVPQVQKACGAKLDMINSALGSLVMTGASDSKPKYFACASELLDDKELVNAVTSFKLAGKQVSCDTNFPDGKLASFDEKSGVRLSQTWVDKQSDDAGFTRLLFHELMHSKREALTEKQVEDLTDCCVNPLDLTNPKCASFKKTAPDAKKPDVPKEFASCNAASNDCNVFGSKSVPVDGAGDNSGPTKASSKPEPAQGQQFDTANREQAKAAARNTASAAHQAVAAGNSAMDQLSSSILPKAQAAEKNSTRGAPNENATTTSQATNRQQVAPRAGSAATVNTANNTASNAGSADADDSRSRNTRRSADTDTSPRVKASTTGTSSQGSGSTNSGGGSAKTFDFTVTGTKADGTPILKDKGSGAEMPTFVAFSDIKGPAAPPSAVRSGGSTASKSYSSSRASNTSEVGGAPTANARQGGVADRGEGVSPPSQGGGGFSGGSFAGSASTGSGGRAASGGNSAKSSARSTASGSGSGAASDFEDLRSSEVNSPHDIVGLVRKTTNARGLIATPWFNKHLVRFGIQIIDGNKTYGEQDHPRARWRLDAVVGGE